jgi:molybdopterin converting factor small subunit
MPHLQLKYLCHILVATGKMDEEFDAKGETVLDLIMELDNKYPGLKEIFIPPENNLFNARTAITLARPGEPTRGVSDPNFKLKDGDTVILW